MKRLLIPLALVASLWSSAFALRTSREMPQHIDVGGHRLRTLVTGKEDGPVVVFECHGEAPLEWWSRVHPEVARFARCVSYDHAGFHGSEPGPKPRDARRIARELRAALRSAELPPPYLLVGHSFGGPYARVFADLYRDETAGLVLVDPTQEEFIAWLGKKYPKFNRISREELESESEWGCAMASLAQARNAPLPSVPVTLITASKTGGPLRMRLVPNWVQSHKTWINALPHGRHIITERSTHSVPYEEPRLIVEVIRQMLAEVKAR